MGEYYLELIQYFSLYTILRTILIQLNTVAKKLSVLGLKYKSEGATRYQSLASNPDFLL